MSATPTIYVPTRTRVRLRDLWTSLPVVWVLAGRDLKAKYKQSLLGPLWLIIQPLGLLAAFTVVFTGVTKVDTSGIPYALFGLVGLTVWSFLQASLMTGAMSIVTNAKLVRRVNCPRLAFPTSSLVASLPILAITFVPTLISVYALGYQLPLQALLLPLAIIWLFVFTWSWVAIMSALSSRYRDILGILPFLLQAGVFLSPVGYAAGTTTSTTGLLLTVNPLSGLIEFWRWCVLNTSFDPTLLISSLAWTFLTSVGGWWLFSRWEVTMADYV